MDGRRFVQFQCIGLVVPQLRKQDMVTRVNRDGGNINLKVITPVVRRNHPSTCGGYPTLTSPALLVVLKINMDKLDQTTAAGDIARR